MKTKLLLLLIAFAFINNAFAQGGAMADLKFEEAETAFNRKDYETTIKKLDEFDKLLGSIKDKSLYLRIISQDKLFEPAKLYENESQFNLLTSLRKNTNAYLKAMESNGLDDRYREVYAINEKLVKYPSDKTTWLKEKQKLITDINNKIKAEKIKLEEFKKKDIERGVKIQNYEFDSGLISININYNEITTNRKGNLKPNENIPNYKYLRHNYSFSGLNPKNGLPEISEILLNEEDKVSGYCLLFLDANRNKRNKLECDGVYSSIKEKLNLDSGIEWNEFNEKVSYTDNSIIHTFFYYSTSKNSNNTLLLAYIFREFPNTPKYNTALIEYFKLPYSSEKLNSNKIRYISDSPGYNGYNQIYELLK